MGKIIVTERENRIGINITSGPNISMDKGSLTASAGATQGTVNLYDDVSNVFIARNQPYADFVDSSQTALGSDASATVTALNNIVNASPETFVKDSDSIAALTGVTAADFTSKTGFTVIVGQQDESITTSGKLLFTSTDIKLGDDLNVQNYSIYTTTTNGDIQLTPNGTGSINLDGTIKFKRFDSTGSPPDAFLGGMYADDADNLYFAIDEPE